MITTERESTVYARWPLDLTELDGVESSETIDKIEVAATDEDTPDQRPGQWTAVDDFTDAQIRVLIGPDQGERPATLTHDGPGGYQLWLAITTPDEHIVERTTVWEVT